MSAVSQPYAPNATVYWTTYTYDGSGRTLTVTAPDGASTTIYTYQGNGVTVTDPTWYWKTSAVDAYGNLVLAWEPNPAGGNFATQYYYTPANQLSQVTMTRGNVTQYRYFSYSGSDLVSATNPENGTVTYTYDLSHHVLSRTDALGQQTVYTYDSYGRLSEVQYYPTRSPYDGTIADTIEQVTYSYDAGQYGLGRLTSVTFDGGVKDSLYDAHYYTYAYTYNQAGRVTNQTVTLQAATGNNFNNLPPVNPPIATFTVGYQWDDEGRMTSMQSPTVTPSSYSSWPYPTVMPTMGYQYDINGRMTEMTSNGSAFATASYTAAGQLYQLSYGGMTETRTYNSMMQLIAQSVPGYLNMTYNYSTAGHNNGRITSSVDGITGENTTYTYDVLNRLTAASNSLWNQTYTYDGFGNLLTKSQANGSPNPSPSMSVSYNANNQQTSGVGYDANGNTNSANWYSYGYTVENKMNSQTYNYWPFGVSLYAYDPWGKRVMKETNPDPNNYEGEDSPAWEFYFYSITGQRLVTMDCNNPNGNPIPSCWVVGESLYFKQRMLVSNGVYVVTDRLGSVRANTQGGTFAYYPYGEERTTNPNGLDKYATYFRDAAGQDYADQRYYNAGTGRFWSVDPGGIATASPGNPTSWNRYAYVQGDPVNYTDRGGREREAAGNDVNCWESPENPDCYSDGSGGGGGGPNTYLPEYPAPDQGGGGGNFAAFADVVTLTQLLRHELASELQNLSANCYKAFGTVGVTQQAMMNGANAMTFYDSTGAAGELTMTEVMSQYGPLGAAGAQTVQAYGTAQGADSSAAVDLQYVPAAPPVGPQAPPFYTPSVILTANFWNQPLGSDPYLVLVHEELHWVSNQGDDDLVKNLNIPQLAGKTSSYDLSAWLASGCGEH